MRLLVTGAGGLLGSSIAEIGSYRHQIFSGFREHWPAFGIPVAMDLFDLDKIGREVERLKPDAILHTAALTDVDKCETEKEAASRVNHRATEVLSESANRVGAFFLYVSTDAVFDGKKGMYRETDQPRPINHYGETKLLGEESVKAAGVEYCIARASVIYGSRRAAQKENFALWVIGKLNAGEVVSIVRDQFVSPSLNSNVAEMTLEAVERRQTGIFHIAGASRVSRYDFAVALADAFGLDASLVEPVTMDEMKWVAKRPRDSSLDVSKAASLLSKKPILLPDALLKLKHALAEGSAS